jgi:septal ring factor EnvC (AmiA/AmiB activator)
MYTRISCTLLVTAALCGVSVTGCKRSGGSVAAELESTKAELETTRQRLAQAEKNVAAQKHELDRMIADAETAKKQASDKEVLAIQRETQIRALQTQLSDRREALTFADISATYQRGLPSIALDRYRQFINDYPKSPLVVDANRALADLTVSVERDAKTRAAFIDPQRTDREALKNFQDGISTVNEITPLLRQKTVAEVVKLLGAPNRTFRNGTEIGYVDKVIDTSTGSRETLVITFQADRVVSLRVGYRGREIKL